MLYDLGDGDTTTADQVTFDEETGAFHAADDTPFSSEQEAVDHNRAVLGLGTSVIDDATGVHDPEGSNSYDDNPVDFSALRPALAGTGGFQNDNSTLQGTGAVDPHLAVTSGGSGVEDFFSNLASTTMNTAGQVLGARMNAEVQSAQLKANQQLAKVAAGINAMPKPVPKAAGNNDTMAGIGIIAVLIGAAIFVAGRKRS